jgi:hypothetical protein
MINQQDLQWYVNYFEDSLTEEEVREVLEALEEDEETEQTINRT